MFHSRIFAWLAFLGLLLFGFYNSKADKTTKNNNYGSWGDNNSWVAGLAPNFTSLPSPIDENYTIQGYVDVGSPTVPQNLSFRANRDAYTITMVDTLVVFGDVDFANSSMNLTISDGGLFIILGNLDMNNKIDISSNGSLVVQGNFNKSGSQGSYTGSGNVYAGSYSGDASALVPDSNEKNAGSDLQNDLPDVFNFVQNNGNTPLPVELLFFKANVLEELVSLTWATASELNNDYFTIERSRNAKDFEIIGKIDGNGTITTPTNYSFTDEQPLLGISYYRLAQTDYDGKTEIFPMISLLFAPDQDSFTVGPNPIKDSDIRLIATGKGKNEVLSLRIVDLQGRTIGQKYLVADQFGNLDAEINLDHEVSKGTYIFELISKNRKDVLKLVRE